MSKPEFERLDPVRYLRRPWKNGRGVLVDIAREGDDWDGLGLVWHYGRTSIIEAGPFSDLTGYDRLQVVIRGEGLVLVTPTGEIDLRRPFRPQRYDGGTPITTRLENGVVEVANLIADKRKARIDLRVGSSGDVLACPAGEHIVHAAAVAAALELSGRPCSLLEDHAVRVQCAKSMRIAVLSGTILIASIYPVAS